MPDRRPQRTECPQCGRRVASRDDGILVPHLVRTPEDGVQAAVPRCPGGLLVPSGGAVVEVPPEPVDPAPRQVDPEPVSVRTVRGGIPGSSRRH